MFVKTERVTNNSVTFKPDTLHIIDYADEGSPILGIEAYWFEYRRGNLVAAFGEYQVILSRKILGKNSLPTNGWKTDKKTYPLMLNLADHTPYADNGCYVSRTAFRRLGHHKPYTHPDAEEGMLNKWDVDLIDMLTFSLPPAETDGWYSLTKNPLKKP